MALWIILLKVPLQLCAFWIVLVEWKHRLILTLMKTTLLKKTWCVFTLFRGNVHPQENLQRSESFNCSKGELFACVLLFVLLWCHGILRVPQCPIPSERLTSCGGLGIPKQVEAILSAKFLCNHRSNLTGDDLRTCSDTTKILIVIIWPLWQPISVVSGILPTNFKWLNRFLNHQHNDLISY